MSRITDVAVRDEGTVWCFSPLTEGAQHWIEEHVEVAEWQWLGATFGADHRAPQELVELLVAVGLTVEVEGAFHAL